MKKLSAREEMANQFHLLNATIDEDITELEQLSLVFKTQTYYRLYVRLIGTSIDVQINFIKAMVRRNEFFQSISLEHPQDISRHELKKKLDEKQSIKKEKCFKDDFVKTINLFLALSSIGLCVNEKSQLVANIADLVEIRNRITHPYLSSDIDISLTEFERCKKTYYELLTNFAVILSMNTSDEHINCDDFLKSI